MVGFVDDSTCTTGGNALTTFEELKIKMTEDAQLWHDLLWASGGKLELPKCGYHLIYYDFSPDGIPYMRPTPPNDEIILTDDNNNHESIKAKSVFTPRKNLGHFKAPGGDCSTQTSQLKKKALQLTNDIIKYKCSRSENRMLYNTVWKPSTEHVLPQSFLTQAQLDSIEKKTLN